MHSILLLFRFFRRGSWSFWSLSISCRICPQLHKEICVWVYALQHCSKCSLACLKMPDSVHPACYPCSPSRSPCFLLAPRLTSLMWVLTSSWANPEASAILPLMLVFLPWTLLELDATDFSEAEPSPPPPSPLRHWLRGWGTHTRASDQSRPTASSFLLAHPQPGHWSPRA